MTDTQLTIIVSSIPTSIAAIGALIGVILSSIRGARRDHKADDKQDVLMAKTDEIHTLTNSNLSALKAELVTANAQFELLRSTTNAQLEAFNVLVTSLKESKVVADSVAAKLAEKVGTPVVSSTDPTKVLVVNDKENPIPNKPIKT